MRGVRTDRGITLFTPGRRVILQGSGLNREARPQVTLFGGLIRHRVPWVREASRAESMQSEEGAVAVDRILWDQ